MTDTSKEIQEIQLQIWLSKSPGERLHQFLIDNEKLFNLFKKENIYLKKKIKKNKNYSSATSATLSTSSLTIQQLKTKN